jgi:uncharacterized protein (TIGR03435 family)
MRQAVSGAGLLFLGCVLAAGQTGDARLEFEVASIKPWVPPAGGGRGGMMLGMRGGPGTADPEQITYSGLPLKFILMNAYDVRPYQINGPGWLDTERFDIVAKVPSGATKEQVRVMLQNLLADRFGLKLHHETKDSQVYELVVDKNGPKFKPTTLADSAATPIPDGPPQPPLGPPKLGKDGFPQLPQADRPGMMMMMTMGTGGPRARMVAKAQTIAQVAQMLGNQVNRPVVDKTGLTGKYDFTLEFEFEPGSGGGPKGLMLPPPPGGFAGGPGGPGPGGAVITGGGGGGAPGGAGTTGGAAGAGPVDSQNLDSTPAQTIFAAVQSQLGLKLEAKKAPLDLLVIDHMEKTPTEN